MNSQIPAMGRQLRLSTPTEAAKTPCPEDCSDEPWCSEAADGRSLWLFSGAGPWPCGQQPLGGRAPWLPSSRPAPGLLGVSSRLPRHRLIVAKGLAEPRSRRHRAAAVRLLVVHRCRPCTVVEASKNGRFVRGRCWTVSEMSKKLSSVSSCKYSSSFHFLPPKVFVCRSLRTNHGKENAVQI